LPPDSPDVTTLLVQWRHGDHAAFRALFARLYDDLHGRASAYLRGERRDHTLSTTDLVHESYLQLVDIRRIEWQDRAHFLAMASRAMRRVLVAHARRHRAAKRGGGATRVRLDEAAAGVGAEGPLAARAERREGPPTPGADLEAAELLDLDLALDRLEAVSERLSRTVELRFFGGLSIDETATALGVAPSTVKLDWEKARAWLYRELAG
jgi:RNA polymerase sigma factor (sigma-70 family)